MSSMTVKTATLPFLKGNNSRNEGSVIGLNTWDRNYNEKLRPLEGLMPQDKNGNIGMPKKAQWAYYRILPHPELCCKDSFIQFMQNKMIAQRGL